jgi:hypothetical protein
MFGGCVSRQVANHKPNHSPNEHKETSPIHIHASPLRVHRSVFFSAPDRLCPRSIRQGFFAVTLERASDLAGRFGSEFG